jgi:tRNA modification GTPase
MRKTFCLLTPPGRSAVATTLIRGPEIGALLQRLFLSSSQKPIKLQPLRPTFGFWSSDGQVSEGLVVCLLDSTSAEIHSHGGTVAPRMIGESLKQAGFEMLTSDELAHELGTAWHAETQSALLSAPTQRTAKLLLQRIQQLPQQLEKLRQLIQSQPESAQSIVDSAIEHAQFGIHLTRPWNVVVCGQPNVGKSSLINALSGFARAIVHDSPGTTRDVVSQVTAIQGWPIELSDTAGIRDAQNEIERQGIERAVSEVEMADLRIALFDASKIWSTTDQSLLEQLKPDLIVHNKCDQSLDDGKRPEGLLISATKSVGLADLQNEIVSALVSKIPHKTQILPVNSVQLERLKQIQSLIRAGTESTLVQAANLLT